MTNIEALESIVRRQAQEAVTVCDVDGVLRWGYYSDEWVHVDERDEALTPAEAEAFKRATAGLEIPDMNSTT